MVDTAGKHWYGTGDIESIYTMRDRFDKAGLGLYDDSYFSQTLGNDILLEEELKQNFRVDNCSVEEALEEGHAFSSRNYGAGKFGNSILIRLYAANYAHARGQAARTPMENYVSPDPDFNTFLKKYPGVVVIADVLDNFEKQGMKLELKPINFGELQPLKVISIEGVMPGMEKNFMEYYRRPGAEMLESSVYAKLDGNGKDIFWVKPTVDNNGRINSINHYLYSPQNDGLKFLDFVNLFIGLESIVPAHRNLRDVYLRKAEEMDPRWKFV